jgi:hypothetical protein
MSGLIQLVAAGSMTRLLTGRPKMFGGWLPHRWVAKDDQTLNALEEACRDTTRTQDVADLLENPTVSPGANNSLCLVVAIQFKHVEAVRLLLKDGRVNVTACRALAWACAREADADIVKMLVAAQGTDASQRSWDLGSLFEADSNAPALGVLLDAGLFSGDQISDGLEDAYYNDNTAIRDAILSRPAAMALVPDRVAARALSTVTARPPHSDAASAAEM